MTTEDGYRGTGPTQQELDEALQRLRQQWGEKPPFCPLIGRTCMLDCVLLNWGYVHELYPTQWRLAPPSCKVAEMLDNMPWER